MGWKAPFRAADAALLDPCDKHRDEGGNAPHRPSAGDAVPDGEPVRYGPDPS
ncbi:hypothetical protein GOA75_27195 [Sinorhizobium meliloti]|nr:hypothetical protein [Sinorhizobium meliloti]MDW9531978.1 hypothetical protein [Sinorhizobium meliloti]MDW9588439.1 hypothetical protein [Sinorhizobium meliloti]MDW9633469.1 hypothetical protein [Sinorhizobium meliloti]MDX0133910.1 hypothetical protein [Sinorhizobium meliloti]